MTKAAGEAGGKKGNNSLGEQHSVRRKNSPGTDAKKEVHSSERTENAAEPTERAGEARCGCGYWSNKALKESEDKYRAVFHNANDAIMLYRLRPDQTAGCFLEVNDVACALLEYSREELLQMTPVQIDAPEYDAAKPDIRRRLREQKQAKFDMEVLAKSGGRVPVEINSQVFTLNGETVVLSVLRDMTEHRKAEQAMEYRLTVEKAVARVASLLIARDDVDMGQVVEILGRAVGASRTYIFRYRDELRYADKLCEWCAEGVTAQLETMQNVPQGKYQWFNGKMLAQETIVLPDVARLPPEAGPELHLYTTLGVRSLLCVPIYSGGTFWGTFGFVDTEKKRCWSEEDIRLLRTVSEIIGVYGEREMAAAELKQYIGELQHTQNILREKEKLALAGQMAAGMAHEVKNPLTSVRGFAQLLKDGCTADKELKRDYLEIILEEVDQACGVISDFLQLARPAPPALELYDLNCLLEEVMDLAGPQAFIRNCTIRCEAAAGLPFCWVDPSQIKQVLLNMCNNAIEAMSDGGEIELRAVHLAAAKEVVIEIKDNGCGIAAGSLGKIGLPFYTTKERGTGLGLSISYSIIEAHGGRTEVFSQEGHGTTFRIYLPEKKRDSEDAPERSWKNE